MKKTHYSRFYFLCGSAKRETFIFVITKTQRQYTQNKYTLRKGKHTVILRVALLTEITLDMCHFPSQPNFHCQVRHHRRSPKARYSKEVTHIPFHSISLKKSCSALQPHGTHSGAAPPRAFPEAGGAWKDTRMRKGW